jgi:putative endopeptidase
MKNHFALTCSGILVAAFAAACTGTNKDESDTANRFPAFEVQGMDTTIHPGDDFFAYVNGNWIKSHPIPEDKNSYSAFQELTDRNRDNIRSIIETTAAKKDIQPGSVEEKINFFFNSGMDTLSIDKQGIVPLGDLMAKIDGIKTITDVQSVAAIFQTYGMDPIFSIFPEADKKNSSMVIANFYQAGIGLPDRDYYFRTDDASQNIREAYVDHLTKMFLLLKDSPESAAKNAQTVIRLETQLARASFTHVENQDPVKTYNKMTLDALKKMAPEVDWSTYLKNIGYPQISEFNVYQPVFLKEVSKMMKSVPADDWKTFLRWTLINNTAEFLGHDFEAQNFDFYYKTLSGQEKMEPRWKRILDVTSGSLGEAVGQLYVKEYFPPEAKQKMIELVGNLKISLRKRIEVLSWIGEETKMEALAKLDKIVVKVGYPDKWRDYAGLTVVRDSYVQNILNSNHFEFTYAMDKIGKPVDPSEWEMTPQTVNAYYQPNKNEIVFPAGILQPPFFNLYADDAINYGGIGLVIGHEMTHGFDNMGRQFDKDGNLHDWWTAADSKAFEEHTSPLIDQYGTYEVLDSLFINGKLTLGENIADLGGATVAYNAYQLSLAGKAQPEKIDGFTGNQRFFLSYATIWRNNMREQSLRKRVLTDEHSPAKYRVNGVVYNMPEFYAAFPQVNQSNKLFRPEPARPVIW